MITLVDVLWVMRSRAMLVLTKIVEHLEVWPMTWNDKTVKEICDTMMYTLSMPSER
jgi:hypothetical protein